MQAIAVIFRTTLRVFRTTDLMILMIIGRLNIEPGIVNHNYSYCNILSLIYFIGELPYFRKFSWKSLREYLFPNLDLYSSRNAKIAEDPA